MNNNNLFTNVVIVFTLLFGGALFSQIQTMWLYDKIKDLNNEKGGQ